MNYTHRQLHPSLVDHFAANRVDDGQEGNDSLQNFVRQRVEGKWLNMVILKIDGFFKIDIFSILLRKMNYFT